MGDNMGRKAHAIYYYFAVESGWAKYKLRLGAYTGTDVRAIACVCVHTNLHTYVQYHR